MLKKQDTTLKKLMSLIEARLIECEEKRKELVLSLNMPFGVRGPLMTFPPGGKKKMRQTIRTRISEFEGGINELKYLKDYLSPFS